MVLGAAQDERVLPAAAAGLFAAVVVAAGLGLNAPLWRGAPRGIEASAGAAAMRGNVGLAALVYAWGALALLAVYSLTGLEWRHGWQYGLGAALLAAGLSAYWRRLAVAGALVPPAYLNALHGLAASLGLIYLVGAGKLASTRSDWAANDVFLSGGLAIVALCAIAAVTLSRLERRNQSKSPP